MELELRNDVYRRPLVTALDRLGLREGWKCADVGAGGGDVTVALARVVGRDGRVYAVDSDPARRDEVAAAAAACSCACRRPAADARRGPPGRLGCRPGTGEQRRTHRRPATVDAGRPPP